MALGQLVVRMGLDASEFVRGMSRADAQAQRFSQNIQRQVGAVNALKAVLGTISVGALIAGFDKLLKNAGELKDLEERIGATAESIGSLALAAGTAGVGLAEIETASIKLTKALTDVDDESKAAGAALVALGLPVKAFKALDPVQQMEEIAKALAKFQDGAQKTAVAVALFGKAGAQQLPFLRELAKEGGRQVILTQKQIELADEYADRQGRLTTQIRLYAQAMAIEAVPALDALGRGLKQTISQAVGFEGASRELVLTKVKEWAQDAAIGIGILAESLIFAARGARAFIGSLEVIAADIDVLLARSNAPSLKPFGSLGFSKEEAAAAEKALIDAEARKEQIVKVAGQRYVDLVRVNAAAATDAMRAEFAKIPVFTFSDARFSKFGAGGPKLPVLNFAGAVKKDVDKAKRELEGLRDFVDKLGQQGLGDAIGLDDKTIADLERLDEAVRRLNLSETERGRLIDIILNNDTKLRQEQEKKNKVFKDWLQLLRKGIEDSEDYLRSVQEEAGAIGLVGDALIDYQIQLKKTNLLRDLAKGVADIKVELDSVAFNAARADLAAIQADILKVEDRRTVTIDVDVRGAREDIIAVSREAASIVDRVVQIGVDTGSARLDLVAVRNELLSIADRAVKVDVDTGSARGDLAAVGNDLRSVVDRMVKLGVDPTTLNSARKSIAQVSDQLAAIVDPIITVGIAGQAAVVTALDALDRKVRAPDWTIALGVNAEPLADARKAIAAVAKDALTVADRTVRLGLDEGALEEAGRGITTLRGDLASVTADQTIRLGVDQASLAAAHKDIAGVATGLAGLTIQPTAQAKIVKNFDAAGIELKRARQKQLVVDATKASLELVEGYVAEFGALGKVGLELQHYNIELAKQKALKDILNETDREYIANQFEIAKSVVTALDAQKRKLEEITSANDAFRSSFIDNVVAVASGTKSIKEAIKGMADDIVKQLNQIAAKKLSDFLFGEQGSAGGGFFDISKLFSGLLGGSGTDAKKEQDKTASGLTAMLAAATKSGGGLTALSTEAALATATLTTTIPPLTLLAANAGLAASALATVAASSATKGAGNLFGDLFSGGDPDPFGIGGWALGGPMAANQPGWVGEHGKELFVPQVKGQIIPNNQLNKTLGGTTNHLKIDVHVAGNTSRQSATQIATEVGIRVQRALARNT